MVECAAALDSEFSGHACEEIGSFVFVNLKMRNLTPFAPFKMRNLTPFAPSFAPCWFSLVIYG